MPVDFSNATPEEVQLYGLASLLGKAQVELKTAQDQRDQVLEVVGEIVKAHPELIEEFPQHFKRQQNPDELAGMMPRPEDFDENSPTTQEMYGQNNS